MAHVFPSHTNLYGILDTGYAAPQEFGRILSAMLAGGIDVVQLRAKNLTPDEIATLASPLYHQCQESGVPFIINDHPALWPLAHGVHVGQDDATISHVREIAGERAIIVGKSTHSLAQAEAAAAEGADYIGFGPLFPTPTKAGRPAIGLGEIAAVHQRVHIPIFCIGGIKRENLPEVMAAGARRVVIVSGILQAVDISAYVADCKRLLSQS